MSVDKESCIYNGNAITDGGGGWFIGNWQATGTMRNRSGILMKYGIHHAGEECADAWKTVDKVTVSILLDGGPFVHWFRNDPCKITPFSDGTKEDVRVLERAGDYLIYEPKVLHKWKALRDAIVLTMQFPPEQN